MTLRKQPEETRLLEVAEDLRTEDKRPGSNPCSAASLLCECGQSVYLAGPLLPLQNKEMGFHLVKGRDSLFCLFPATGQGLAHSKLSINVID